jgi:uncharacterized protein with PIN domain
MAIVKTTETLECCECNEKLPPWTAENDGKVERPMRDRQGNIRCENCHDDYLESISED